MHRSVVQMRVELESEQYLRTEHQGARFIERGLDLATESHGSISAGSADYSSFPSCLATAADIGPTFFTASASCSRLMCHFEVQYSTS